MGVEWAEWSEPADTHADRLPGRRGPRRADDLNTGGLPAADQVVGRDAPVALTDPERRIAEHRRYLAIVHRALGSARGADTPGPDSPANPDDPARPRARDTPASDWANAVPGLRAAWEEIKVKYAYTERRVPTPQPADGSWLGDGGRRLDAAKNAEIDRGYAGIREAGERSIIPRLRAVEAEDPTRHLAGFEHRFKGQDRLKEKAADEIRSTPGITPAQALSAIPDVVRFTYEYEDTNYTAGVRRDVERLEGCGFVQVERRNTWNSDQYKGINSRWREPESGVTFEVQFHTQASLEAKELTHKAYERIRSVTEHPPETDRETAELKEFQRQVNAKIPIPPGVMEYQDYRPERRNGRRD